MTLTEAVHLNGRTDAPLAPQKICAERAVYPPQEIVGVELTLTTIHVQQQHPTRFEHLQHGRWISKTVDPECITIRPAGSTINVRWTQPAPLIGLSLPDSALRLASYGLTSPDQLGLPFRCGVEDREISRLALLLAEDSENGQQLGELYSEALSSALVLALIHRYGNPQVFGTNPSGALGTQSLRRVLEYIDDHLADKLSVQQLAQVANSSPFHFSRRFREATGVSVHQFVIEKRLERARALLKNPALSLLEIAFSVGFANPSHLSLHFRRRFGCPPGTYRRNMVSPKP